MQRLRCPLRRVALRQRPPSLRPATARPISMRRRAGSESEKRKRVPSLGCGRLAAIRGLAARATANRLFDKDTPVIEGALASAAPSPGAAGGLEGAESGAGEGAGGCGIGGSGPSWKDQGGGPSTSRRKTSGAGLSSVLRLSASEVKAT